MPRGKPPCFSAGIFIPVGFFADYGPKGTGGERKAPSAPAGATPCPGGGLTRRLRRGRRACSPMGRSIALGGDPKISKGRAESPLVRPQAHTPPPAGPDAPTPARIGTCRPKGRSHFSFGGERKVCKRKPAARRLREKALYCPFLKEGVRNVARSMVR